MFKSLFGKEKKKNEVQVEAYLLDAIDLFEQGEFQRAADMFDIISRAYPDHPLAFLMLGRCYIEMNRYSMAIEMLFKHLSIVPTSIEGCILLGLAYYECGEYDRATERFEYAMELRSECVLARENLAITKILKGELDSAVEDLTELHEQYPEDRNIIELIVLTFGKLGKWETAKQYATKMR